MLKKLFKSKANSPTRSIQLSGGGSDHPKPRPMPEFTKWLLTAGETGQLTKNHLLNLYGEWVLHENGVELTEGQFFRRLRDIGIEKYREGVGKRRWLYRVRSADIIAFRCHADTS